MTDANAYFATKESSSPLTLPRKIRRIPSLCHFFLTSLISLPLSSHIPLVMDLPPQSCTKYSSEDQLCAVLPASPPPPMILLILTPFIINPPLSSSQCPRCRVDSKMLFLLARTCADMVLQRSNHSFFPPPSFLLYFTHPCPLGEKSQSFTFPSLRSSPPRPGLQSRPSIRPRDPKFLYSLYPFGLVVKRPVCRFLMPVPCQLSFLPVSSTSFLCPPSELYFFPPSLFFPDRSFIDLAFYIQ